MAEVPDTAAMIVAARVTANYALLLLDQDRFEEAWPLFTDVYRGNRGNAQSSLAAEVGSQRTRMGTVTGRELVSEDYFTEVREGSPYSYVVLVFNSTAGTGTSVEEEVLMMPAGDRAWAVGSYLVGMRRELPVPAPAPVATPTPAVTEPRAGIMDPIDAARIVSDSVLMLLDNGRYNDAWPLFTDVYRRGRDDVSGLSYEIEELRSQFGGISRRTLTTEEHGNDMPMALPGEYVVFRFSSTTTTGTTVDEEVLLSPVGGGAWGVSSYTVRATRPAGRNTKT